MEDAQHETRGEWMRFPEFPSVSPSVSSPSKHARAGRGRHAPKPTHTLPHPPPRTHTRTHTAASAYGPKSQGSIADSVSTFLIDANLAPFLGFGCEILQKGKPAFSYSYGYSTNENKYDWSDSTIFNLGSVSKLFTAIAVVKLADEGLLSSTIPSIITSPSFWRSRAARGRPRRSRSWTCSSTARASRRAWKSLSPRFSGRMRSKTRISFMSIPLTIAPS